MSMISKKIVLRFSTERAGEPIIHRLSREYDLIFNILKGRISPQEGGILALELSGKEKSLENGIKFLKKLGIVVQPLSHEVIWDERKCTQCGACIGFCPTGAFSIDRKDMTVSFNAEKCIVCEVCIKACPARAIEIPFL